MEPKRTLAQKLLEFQSSVEAIKKDGKNSFFKKPDGKASTYATLPNILNEVKPLLNALKLIVTQPIIGGEVQTIITDSESNEVLVSGIAIPAGLNAQQTGSAITYFRRYTLSSLLALEIDEDDDGNKASQKPPEKAPEKKAPEKHSNKPPLTDALLKKALVRIKAGEVEVKEKMQENFTLTESQKQTLISA